MKHIIVALDGTWRAAYSDPFHSNVYRMNLAFEYRDKNGNPQMFIYVSGVGTYGKSSWLSGGWFGEGLDQLILGAYINLLSNYEDGDKIYIFGFSRGALAARALSGMISYAGLLYPDQSALMHSAWNYYLGHPVDNYEGARNEAIHDNVAIEFLGTWDTVYGRNSDNLVARRKFDKLRIKNLALDPSIKTGIQILAIDETRTNFHPLHWTRKKTNQFCEHIWMPGVHTDVGGGYRNGLLSNISILSMIAKVAESCPDIEFDCYYIEEVLMNNIRLDPQIVINNEWRSYWGSMFDHRAPRVVPDHSADLKHTVHPLTKILSGRIVDYKGVERAYAPAFSNTSNTINNTSLDGSVVDWQRVESLIRDKF